MMTTLPNRHYGRHCKITEEDSDPEQLEKRSKLKKMCMAGFRYSRKKTEAAAQEIDGDNWSAAHASLAAYQ